MKCDELIEKIKQADDDYRHKFIPINLDIEIEDLLGAFEELKAENERKDKLLESAKRVEARYRVNHKSTRRALWLARAELAHIKKWKTDDPWEVWNKVEKLCRAKAEQYKEEK